jgi:hypothetical protein
MRLRPQVFFNQSLVGELRQLARADFENIVYCDETDIGAANTSLRRDNNSSTQHGPSTYASHHQI